MEKPKLTDEHMEKMLNAIGIYNDIEVCEAIDQLKAAGYGIIPAETPPEKARRLWEEWAHDPHDGITSEAALQIVPPLLAEIDRLKSEAWTEEDLWWISFETIAIYAEKGGWRDGAHNKLRDIISARRAAKAKE